MKAIVGLCMRTRMRLSITVLTPVRNAMVILLAIWRALLLVNMTKSKFRRLLCTSSATGGFVCVARTVRRKSKRLCPKLQTVRLSAPGCMGWRFI